MNRKQVNTAVKPYKLVVDNSVTTEMKSFRLSSPLVTALQEKADALGWDQTLLVETILAISLGVREAPEPLKVYPLTALAKKAKA